jgi:hypothetical protein
VFPAVVGRNLLRFVVVLLLFKLRRSKENEGIVGEIHFLLKRCRRHMPDDVAKVLNEYKAMFAQYFSLQASPSCLHQYASLPIAMQQRYGGQNPQSFSSPFPRNIFM